MVNAKVNGNASTSVTCPQNDTAKTALTGTTKMNLEESLFVSESKGKVENIMEEVKNKEKTVVIVKTEEKEMQEENNRENAIAEEEKNEENATEEDENNEEDAMEEEEAEEDAMGEEEAEEDAMEEKEAEEDAMEVKEAEEDAMEEKEAEENAMEEEAVENAIEEHNDKVADSSKEGRKRGKRSRRKKVAQGDSKVVATAEKDKPESSRKTKVSKKAETMGLIFMCSSKTKKDCYRYKVLGLPESKRDLVQKVYKGMRLFLFDVDLRLMYGIYKAAGPGGFNIEPKAFESAFPSQVRFTVLEDCLPLAEEKFKKVIKDNYYSRNKFDSLLTSEQVKELCRLFIASNKRSKSKNVGRSLRADMHKSVDPGRNRRRVLDKKGRSAMVGEWRYHERPAMYEREVFASPLAPLARGPPLPPPAPAQSYVYERTFEMDAYRRDPLSEHRSLRLLDLEPRRRDEIGSREPYISYGERELPSYRAAMYSASLQPEYHTPAALPSEYRSLGQLAEYRSAAGLRAEYHSPVGLPPDYRSTGLRAEYHSSAGALPEYHSLRPLYRY